jgi:LL-H family phage holin
MTDITPIIGAVITLLGVIITTLLIPYLRTKLSTAQQEKIQNVINIAVFAAEQMFRKPGSGAEKKSFVLEYLEKRGITYDPETIDLMIEATVKELNIAQGA